MTLRIAATVKLQISKDASMQTTLYDNTRKVEAAGYGCIDKFNTAVSNLLELGPSQTIDIDFGLVGKIRGFFLQTNGPCDVLLNNSTEVISMDLADSDAVDPTSTMYITCKVTRVRIKAPPDKAIKGDFAAWGYQELPIITP